MSSKGLFITFEGSDGTGKSTQLKKVAEYLKEKGLYAITTRDPGGTALGCKIREILLYNDGEEKISPCCELLLYLADRAQHVEEKILPALNDGNIVLCDRYIDSTIAYQGYARGMDINKIKDLNSVVTKSLMPDLTFVFDVKTEVADKRIGIHKDRMELEGISFQNAVRTGFKEIAKENPDRIKVVDANGDIETVFESVKIILDEFLETKLSK